MILQEADSKPISDFDDHSQCPENSIWKIIDRILSRALLGGLIVRHRQPDILALLRGLRGALVSRGLKALFLHLSRALLGILSGALLCHFIMADFTLNIAAML